MEDLELGEYKENEYKIFAVRCIGTSCWVFSGLVVFFFLISNIQISGVTEVPSYAKTLMYLSLAHHMTDVNDAISSVSPPPPLFR
jgi:hypothetical protein